MLYKTYPNSKKLTFNGGSLLVLILWNWVPGSQQLKQNKGKVEYLLVFEFAGPVMSEEYSVEYLIDSNDNRLALHELHELEQLTSEQRQKVEQEVVEIEQQRIYRGA